MPELVTLENVFTDGVYNDLAFKVGDRLMILVEHQSTPNPNMPLRMLMYVAEEYQRVISGLFGSIYGKKVLQIPSPEFYVVYTGTSEFPSELKLSEAYRNPECSSFLDLKVQVIKNAPKYTVMGDFIGFVYAVQNYRIAGYSKEDSIHKAINDYKQGYTISKFLQEGDAIKFMMERLSFDEAMEIRAREAEAEGREKGIAEGREKGIAEGRAEGIEQVVAKTIVGFRKSGKSRDFIKEYLISILDLDTKEADKLLNKYFNK